MQNKNHKITIPIIPTTNTYNNNNSNINYNSSSKIQDHKLDQFLMYHKLKAKNKDTSELKNLITSYNLKSQVNIANYTKNPIKPNHKRLKSSKSDALTQTDNFFNTVEIHNDDNNFNFNFDEKNLFTPGRKIFKIKGYNFNPKLVRSLKEEDYNVTQTIINTWNKKIGKFSKSKEKNKMCTTGNTFFSTGNHNTLSDFTRIKSADSPKKIRKEIIDINLRQLRKDIDVDKLVKPLNLMLISKNKFSQINNNSNSLTMSQTISSNLHSNIQNNHNDLNTCIKSELLRNSSSKDIVSSNSNNNLNEKRRRIKKQELDLLSVRPNFILPEKVNPILDTNLKNFKTELKLNMRKVKDLHFALQSQQRKIDETISQSIVKVRRDKNRVIKGNIFNID
jgi:hypothetical protein